MDTTAIKRWTVVDVAHAITFQLRIKSFVSLLSLSFRTPSLTAKKKTRGDSKADGQKGVADPPKPLAGFHRTWTSLLPLATARFDMLFQTSNNTATTATTKKKNHERGDWKIYFSPLDF